MTPERLTELRDKVRHGYNLLAAEAREVFQHFWEPIEPPRARCRKCGGEGFAGRWHVDSVIRVPCDACCGTGYVPVVGEVCK